MALLQAKCTNCGGILQVDGSNDAAICPYCNSAFVVEKAVANFFYSNVSSVNASVVNIYNHETTPTVSVNVAPAVSEKVKLPPPSRSFMRKVSLANRFSKSIQHGLILRSDGQLDVLEYGSFRRPMHWVLNYKVFRWNNIKEFKILVFSKADIEYPFVVALTFDGKCYADSLYFPPDDQIFPKEFLACVEKIRTWSGIESLIFLEKRFAGAWYNVVGLRYDGTVISSWGDNELSLWKNVVKICGPIAGSEFGFVGLTTDGQIYSYGVKSWFKNAVEKWNGIVDISNFSDSLLGLLKDGTVVKATFEDPVHRIDSGVLSLKDPCLNSDGSFSYRSWNESYDKVYWDLVAQLGKGYVCRTSEYFLSEDGRVDAIQNYQIYREIETDVIAFVWVPTNNVGGPNSTMIGFLKKDGMIYCSRLLQPIQILIGEPYDYGHAVSNSIPKRKTDEKLKTDYLSAISESRRMLKAHPYYENRADRKERKIKYSNRIDFYEDCLRAMQR